MKQFIEDEVYLEKLVRMLGEIDKDENDSICKAAKYAYESIRNGGVLHVFSTGHSHMIVEEMFYRTGGIVPINPILSSEFMLHEGAIAGTINERTPGKATILLEKHNIKPIDTILISSNSGINVAPVEAAIYAKDKGLKIIVVTSKKSSVNLQPRHMSNKRLMDLGDVIIDNHAPDGDGLLTLPQTGQKTGGASTFGSLFIAQKIVLKIENLFVSDGLIPPVFTSANIPGGDQFNEGLINQYKDRIWSLQR